MGTGAGAVLLAGGTGFIGSAVLRELDRARGRHGTWSAPIFVMSRKSTGVTDTAGTRHLVGDLANPSTLRDVCSGVGTVIHAASYVGRDPQRCHDVNHAGTRALLDDAHRHGVRRFVYISTASVYGAGPHRGLREDRAQHAPASVASMTRLRAEEEVRGAGGIVLRPHLVYGAGDRWFVPNLARVLRENPTWPSSRPAYSSVIAVEDLARAVVALAFSNRSDDHGEVFHAADPRPLSTERLLTAVCSMLSLPEPRRVPIAEHRARTRRALPGLSEHQYVLLTEDHWYDAGRLWRRTGLKSGPGFDNRFAACAPWYVRQLTAGG
ncbi:NAD-dependent epimerase/dehydratase family protein [Streptomyces sp. TRM 70361]|nr:NAD-dependent epimerase/dehydratase family protein [Streptomyces sp. TRM 70361]MEE1941971.1 NAD-dependent epimerase/dehydratase family protein [Streptomyces sp. TRM 70361]